MNTAISEAITVVLSSPTADATAATEVFEWAIPFACTLLSVSAHCDSDNPPTGSAAQIDINDAGTSILSTKITIDAGEYHTSTAATAPVLTTTPTAIAKDAVLTFDIDQIGSTNAGKGYAVVLNVLRPIVGA